MKRETRLEMEAFMRNIAWLRKSNGLSKKRMAELLQISIKTLNKIENGIMPQKMSVKVVYNIQKHFGIHLKDQWKDISSDNMM